MITVTRRFEISYSHFLNGYCGDCSNLHGHNAIIEVTFAPGAIDKNVYPGMVLDFKEINSKVGAVLDRFDHKHLNDVDLFAGMNPTAENMATVIAQEIKAMPDIKADLVSVKVTETADSWAIWYNDRYLSKEC